LQLLRETLCLPRSRVKPAYRANRAAYRAYRASDRLARIPQLQQYARNHAKITIHVTLYTRTEYRELPARGPLVESKYDSLLGAVELYTEGYMILLHYINSLKLE
jgi:hypothetical protein